MTDYQVSTPASELSRAESGSDLATFISHSRAIAVPDDCIPGIADAWRLLAQHWRHLGEDEAA